MKRRVLSDALLQNGKEAMSAAIEIYNKPHLDHRDQCCSVLLINAWELVWKALLSSKGGELLYRESKHADVPPLPKFTWRGAFKKVVTRQLLPKELPARPIELNLDLVADLRNSAVHSYRPREVFVAALNGLAQSNVTNFMDLRRLGLIWI